MENLLSERSRAGGEDESSCASHSLHPPGGHGMIKYGSTGSISSIGSAHNLENNPMLHHHAGGRAATYTPSSLYSQDSTTVPTMYFGKVSSTESVLVYDAIPKKAVGNGTGLKKSNSRVSSTGKLRLRVESFRNNKSSSGTQTDISVMKSNKNEAANSSSNNPENQNTHSESKYTGQYKKNTAPNKPARKHKPKSGSSGHDPNNGESRSDRSASPDNSSTSGYSSPSAGLHSKESSPCGSKIPSPPHSLEQGPDNEGMVTNYEGQDHHRNDEEPSSPSSPEALEDANSNADESSRITVIQIDAGDKPKSSSDEGSESSASESPMNINPVLSERTVVSSKTLPFTRHTKRELPRIATNGTLGRPPIHFNPQTAPKRKLPEARPIPPQPSHVPPPPEQHRIYQQQRIYRSNLPRPAPIHQFGPSTTGGRVPLPPVPELDRSDHERESMSPTPSSVSSPRFRPLPSPLTTPVQPAGIARGIGPAKLNSRRGNTALSPSRIPMASAGQPYGRDRPSEGQKAGVEDRLRILLSLLENGKEDAKNGREDTLQYLSQLESVARRLKDQLLNDNVSDDAKVISSSKDNTQEKREKFEILYTGN